MARVNAGDLTDAQHQPDEESVILTFPLPDELQNNPPKDLKVVFTPSFLNIHAPRHPDLSLSHRKLWGPIDTSLSTWSFDGGRLTIAMEKTHQGTTWPTIFDESITDSTFNPPQQYSDDQLEAMKDVLSHMTSEHAEEGEGPPSSSLLGDGADRDELSNSGDHLVRKQVFDVHSGNITAEASQPFELLSTALPIAGQPQAHLAPSLVVKRQVDGLLLDGSWRHTSTYPVS